LARKKPGKKQAPGVSQLESLSGKYTSASAKLDSIYRRVPVFPYLDRATSALLIVSIAIYVLFTLGVLLSNPSSEITASVTEGPLVKNARLALMPGERYEYEFSSPAGSQLLGYRVSHSSQCEGVLVSGGLAGQPVAACLSPSGNLVGDFFWANSSLGNQSMPLFSPWMLAVSENFSWQVKTSMNVAATRINLPTSFTSLGRKTVAGRSAFEILVQSDIGPSSKYYIDEEKRVLLYADLGNVTAKLTSAPFELNWSNGVN
jgi:hypothetical protein